ncbi:hypothetical protein CRG98_029739 [Punica granatum]|uniref:Uncharacterized protein n=1 Tax=Punica granatum TaxID=22663 RepID=A0A2I0J1I3_PUNGR|nr:hypothetical protein CRG98_029739 [Punica granatum]
MEAVADARTARRRTVAATGSTGRAAVRRKSLSNGQRAAGSRAKDRETAVAPARTTSNPWDHRGQRGRDGQFEDQTFGSWQFSINPGLVKNSSVFGEGGDRGHGLVERKPHANCSAWVMKAMADARTGRWGNSRGYGFLGKSSAQEKKPKQWAASC